MTGAVADGTETRRISIFDTTLRDGEQAPGNGMTPEQKLQVGLQLEALGVDLIEVGFPAASPADFKAAQLLSENLRTARFTTFCRAVRRDIEQALLAGGTANHQVQILATGSDFHLTHKRGITRADAVREVRDSTAFAAASGIADISVGIEDASRGEPELLRALTDAAHEAGATTIVICDTSGCLTPGEFGDLVALMRPWIPANHKLSIHCHDDMGLGVANALAGITAGADEVQVTLAGIGERAGNTALEELAATLLYRGDRIGAHTAIRTERLFEAFQVLSDAIDLHVPSNKALFGANAFATQAGIHQAGMLRNPETYEYIDPKRFGRERAILVGRHSGSAVVRHLLDQLGIPAERELVTDLYNEFIANHSNRQCDTLAGLRERLKDHFTLAAEDAQPVPATAFAG
jgi:2-isopropylmalate synthase